MNIKESKIKGNANVMDCQKSSEKANRIKQIRKEFCNGNNIEFAQKLGVSKQYSSGLCSGKENISAKTLEYLLEVFPEVSRLWLYFGEGDMMVDKSRQSTAVAGDNSGIVVQHGDNSTYNNNVTIPDLLQVVSSQQQSIKELIEQNKILTQIISDRL